MFLKRLTMKGFKSFADTTVLEFEPGVTAVVGPNGSGKSNVVDAVTWVLGAQSTRALRSGSMSDVIFVGTSSRAALGRAEVSLTLDNASGKLPIDGAEVTISRTLFRNGDSEYAINQTPCRLLDVQELLGDSGVGRQQHMIIGQGQLDSVLNSSSENRRAVIEEAAGVLKHRRRKERAERRLATTQENLERLGDLVREVRRQMRPLERQATAARSYADIANELRDARRALFSSRAAAFSARKRELDEQLARVSNSQAALRREIVTLDAHATSAAGDVASRREELLASALGKLQGLAERARGSRQLLDERTRSLRAALVAAADENVIATLEADAAKLASELTQLSDDERSLDGLRAQLAASEAALASHQSETQRLVDELAGDDSVSDVRSLRERYDMILASLVSLDESAERVGARYEDAERRLNETRQQRDGATQHVLASERRLEEATRVHERALVEADEMESQRREADEALRQAADAGARAQARAEALAKSFDELSGAGGRALVGRLDGVWGSFLDLVDIDDGWESAVESAAGASVAAVVVDGRRSARAALEQLRDVGDVGLVLPVNDQPSTSAPVPDGCKVLRERVSARPDAPSHVGRVLDALFSRAFVAPDWETGMDLAISYPDLVFVTEQGDRFAASGWRLASGRSLVTRSTVDAAASLAANLTAAIAPAQQRRNDSEESCTLARDHVAASASDRARAAADFESAQAELGRLNALVDETTSLVESVRNEREQLTSDRASLRAEADALSERLVERERDVARHDEISLAVQRATEVVEQLRAEVSERATVLSRAEAQFLERRRLIEQRRNDIEARLEGRSDERREAAQRRERLEFDLGVLARLAVVVEGAIRDIALSQEALASTYQEQLEASRAGAQRLAELRAQRTGLEKSLAELSETARAAEIEQAELAVRLNNLEEAVRRDLGVEPHQVGAATYEVPEGVSLEERVSELEERVSSLGPINPLALEELTALEDRYKELDAQVSDVRHARRELQEVLRALDEQIMSTFSAAVADVNEHFSTLIAMLFPGGQGRLVLTEPDDPLNTGVEIEVRPMGRNIRRVSLLSGGERSMAALAFLFAVFRSRPSPFYMMDEVEAALDDVNLQRFLSLVNEFRDEAQLLIVTHQKRTMEAADSLYGVTMVPGGSSKVVSQRVSRSLASEPSPVAAS